MSERGVLLGVTGTDTGVGKTAVTCALLRALRARGLRVAGMKPVETGVSARGAAGTDAAAIARAAGGGDALELVCPVVFPEPLAPMVAAARAGRAVDFGAIEGALATLRAGRDVVVVEGAGGLLVPIDARDSFADVFARWGADLIVVAANRLGVINHTLLTVREAERSGLRVRAVVLNEASPPDPDVADLARETNAETLRALLPSGVALVGFPFLPRRDDDADEAGARAGEIILRAAGITAES